MSIWALPGLMMQALADSGMPAWILYTVVPGWLLLPLLQRLQPESRVAWYFAARVAGFAFLAYLPWLLSHDAAAAFGDEAPTGWLHGLANGPGLVSFDGTTVASTVGLLALAGAALWWRWGAETLGRLRAGAGAIVLGEAVFIATLAFGGALRLISHGIVGQEKFMDMAFLRACVDGYSMPPADPWLFHLPINYYYGGYAVLAAPAKLIGTDPAVAYNLAASMVFALATMMAYALGAEIAQSRRGGLLAAWMTCLAGNMAPLLQFASALRNSPHGPPFVFDWWAPSRVISDELPGQAPSQLITEFPFFSAFHADLHPHLMAMPFGLLAGTCLLALIQSRMTESPQRLRSAGQFLLAAWSLGLLLWINPFDFIGWGLLAAFVLAAGAKRGWPDAAKWVGRGVALAAAACAIVLPFLAHYSLPVRGNGGDFPIAFTEFRTVPGEFILAWGLPLMIVAVWLATVIRQRRRTLGRELRFLLDVAMAAGAGVLVLCGGGVVAGLLAFGLLVSVSSLVAESDARSRCALCLLATGLLLLLACELVHIRDPYGRGLQRMNTVFKFHFIAWAMLGVAAPLLLAESWRGPNGRGARCFLTAAVATLMAVSATYPLLATYGRLASYSALDLGEPVYDGMRFLRRAHPADAEAIEWLRAHAEPGEVMLEAVGPAYGEYARVSVFAPVRTVLGWANHQSVWRGMETRPIENDVRRFYAEANRDERVALLRKYSVKYVHVGWLERRDFKPESLRRLDDLLPRAFTSKDGSAIIYRAAPLAEPGK